MSSRYRIILIAIPICILINAICPIISEKQKNWFGKILLAVLELTTNIFTAGCIAENMIYAYTRAAATLYELSVCLLYVMVGYSVVKAVLLIARQTSMAIKDICLHNLKIELNVYCIVITLMLLSGYTVISAGYQVPRGMQWPLHAIHFLLSLS